MERGNRKSIIVTLLAVCACILAVVAVFTFIPMPTKASAEGEPSVWNGDLAAAGWGDTAENKTPAPDGYRLNAEAKTLEIGSAAALAYFAHEVYIDSAHALDGYTVKLTCDIDLGGDSNIWVPIGTTARSNTPTVRFSGTFDGNGHVISNLSSKGFYDNIAGNSGSYYIDYTPEAGDGIQIPFGVKDNEEYCYGLFGVTANMTVRDLKIVGVDISMPSKTIDGATLKTDGVGSVIGYNAGSLSMINCTAGSDGGTDRIYNVMCVGGLVGKAYAQNLFGESKQEELLFDSCVNYIELGSSDDEEKKGGIAGFVQFFDRCEFVDCTNYGNILGSRYGGGITSTIMGSTSNATYGLGELYATRCVNRGDVVGIYSGGNAAAGGIFATMQLSNRPLKKIEVTDCLNYGNLTGSCWIAGVAAWLQVPVDHQNKVVVNDFYNYGDMSSESEGAQIGAIFGWVQDKLPTNIITGGYCGKVVAPSGAKVGLITSEVDSKADMPWNVVNASNIDYKAPVADVTDLQTAEVEYSADGKTVQGLKEATPNSPFKIIISAAAENIDFGAFVGMSDLAEVTFEADSSLKNIGDWAFAGTGIREIVFPDGVTDIGAAAFGDCSGLTKVTLPGSIVSVGQSAFGNSSVKNVRLTDAAAFGKYALNDDTIIIAEDKAQYDALKSSEVLSNDVKNRLTYPITIEYYELSTGSAVKVGEEMRLHGKPYTVALNDDGLWVNNSGITYVGLPSLGATTPWYASDACGGESLTPTSEVLTDLLNGANVTTFKLFTRSVGASDEFVALDNIVYGREYPLGAINALLAPRSKKVTTETVAITAFNGSTENLPSSIYNAGVYTVTITPVDGEATELTITVAKAAVDLSAAGALQWRVNGSTLADGPVYLVDDRPTLVKPSDGNYTVEAAIDSIVRVRDGAQTLALTETGFTATVKEGSSAQGSGINKYTTTYTLTSDDNHVLTLNGPIVNGSARGLTVTLDGGVATVTKVWYIVAMGNWLVDASGNDYVIADRVYGSSAAFAAPHLYYGNTEGNRNAVVYTLTRSGYNGLEFAPADFDKYLNNTIPAGSYTLRVAAPEVEYYEEYDASGAPVGDPTVCPAFVQDITFEVTAATLSFDQGISGYLNGATFSYLFGDVNTSEENTITINSVNGALENIYRNLPVNEASYWGVPNMPVIEVNLVSDKTNMYSAFTLPGAVGVYDYYYRIRIDNYNIVDSDAQGAPLGFTLAAYGVVELPIISSHQYTGAVQSAFIADGEQYRVVRNEGGISAGTYDVELELIHPECYIWVDQTLTEDHPSLRTVEFVIEQAANAWTRLPNIVNWSFESFDADVNRIRAVPLYLDTGAEMYFKVATDEEGANVVSGLGRITVDRNGKVTDTTVIGLLNGLNVGRYYLVSVVDETANYSSMSQSIGFNVTKAYNAWASGESDLVLPSWVVGDYDPAVNTIAVNPEHGVANIRITDINGNEYYNSVTGVNTLAEAPVGKYLLIAWVDASDNYEALAERTFTIEVLETIGLPWWGTLLIVLGSLAVVAAVLFVLWKKGVFQILTGKLVLAIRTKATVDATIAAVRASKKAEEAKASVAAAKAKERAEERRAKVAAERALPVEERAAALEAKAQVAAAKADKMRARAEAMQARAARMKEQAEGGAADAEAEATEKPVQDRVDDAQPHVEEAPESVVESAVEQPAETEPATSAEAAATATEEPKKTNGNNRPSKKSGTKK